MHDWVKELVKAQKVLKLHNLLTSQNDNSLGLCDKCIGKGHKPGLIEKHSRFTGEIISSEFCTCYLGALQLKEAIENKNKGKTNE